MPADVFTHTVTVAATPAEVWAALQEADTWAHIGPVTEVWDARHDPGGALASYRWSADAAGRRWEGTARTTEAIPLERMSLSLDSPELRGSLTAILAEERPVELTVTLRAESVGMLATLFWGVVRQAIGSGLPHQVEEFGARIGE